MANVKLGEFSLEKMDRAVERVHERLLRTASALENNGIPYAIVGGCAVADWVSRIDESAVRYSNDVDVLIRRQDLPNVLVAMESTGFVHRQCNGSDLFLDGVDGSTRSAVKIVFADEQERPDCTGPVADVVHSERGQGFQLLSLEPLVRMALASFHTEDRMLLRDMLEVGLMDESWLVKLPNDLAARLKDLIDTPNG